MKGEEPYPDLLSQLFDLAAEINQPLAAIVLNARFAERMAAEVALSPELRETLDDIARDGRRAGAIVWKLCRLLEASSLP